MISRKNIHHPKKQKQKEQILLTHCVTNYSHTKGTFACKPEKWEQNPLLGKIIMQGKLK